MEQENKEMQENLQEKTEENNQETKPKMKKKSFLRRHKGLIIFLCLLLLAGGVMGGKILAAKKAAEQAGTVYSFVRTTTLTKGELSSSVSVTGIVESADTSTVSYSAGGTGATPKVKTVEVAVGDTVQKGDLIVTLDTGDIEDSIEKQKESIADAVSKAQKNYDKAKESYEEAKNDRMEYEITAKEDEGEYLTAKSNFETAKASVKSFQTAYDKALATQESTGGILNNANASLNKVNDSLKKALKAVELDPDLPTESDSSAYYVIQELVKSLPYSKYSEELRNNVLDILNSQKSVLVALEGVKEQYEDATEDFNTAKSNLEKAKLNCNYDSYEQTYNTKKATYDASQSKLDQYESQEKSAKDQMESAKDSLADASTNDTLEDLYDQLDNCNLIAETSGKVTSLNASVGSAPTGTIATIQDTENLQVAVTIEEANIVNVGVGMTCLITSDATSDVIHGTLTQIDPVAGDTGSFGAEITVTDVNTPLLIGMNATVEIVQSTTQDCFMVPIDAVGTDEKGETFVYRQSGGEGTQMTFDTITVTTGDSNDYYMEITSPELKEGDVIRSSADLTQGIEEETNSTEEMMNNMGINGGVYMETQDQGPSGGERPSGGKGQGGN